MKNRNIAPHENSELNLLLTGSKTFAAIEKRKNASDYFLAGSILQPGISVQYFEGENGAEVLVTTKRKLISEYFDLLRTGVQDFGIKNYHRKMGALFGYSVADIESFIVSDIHCDCAKCNGTQKKTTK